MKILSILFLFFFTAGFAINAQSQEDAISKYFSKYVDDERFTVVYVSGKMFSMFKQMNIDLEDKEAEAILEVCKELKGLRILTCEENGAQFYKEAAAIINKAEYETLLTVREGKSENVQFLAKQNGDSLHELLLLVGGEDEEFVLISFIGNIDLSKIGQLAKSFEEKEDGKENGKDTPRANSSGQN